MGSKAYTLAQRQEAIALGVVAGAEAASEQLGMDVRTVRKWMNAAGKAPELAAPATGWAALLDLAMSKVTSALAGNRVRPKDAAVIAGIASRNIRDKPPEPEQDEVAEFVDLWVEEVEAFYPGQADLALRALLDGGDVPEDDPRWDDPLAYLRSLGDLEAWQERRKAEDHAAMERQLTANRKAAEAWQQRSLDDETQALVGAAEAYLAEGAGDAV